MTTDTVELAVLPGCDIHAELDGTHVPAAYDGALINVPGLPGAYMCTSPSRLPLDVLSIASYD